MQSARNRRRVRSRVATAAARSRVLRRHALRRPGQRSPRGAGGGREPGREPGAQRSSGSPRRRTSTAERANDEGRCPRMPDSTGRMPSGKSTITRGGKPERIADAHPRAARVRESVPHRRLPFPAAPPPRRSRAGGAVVGTLSTLTVSPVRAGATPRTSGSTPHLGLGPASTRGVVTGTARASTPSSFVLDGPTGPFGPANPSPRHRCPRDEPGGTDRVPARGIPSPSRAARRRRPHRSGRCCTPSRS